MTTPSRTKRRPVSRASERGAVLVTVLTMMLLFVAMGGAALLITRNVSGYAQNREYANKAFYVAEAAFNKAITQMMIGTSINADSIVDLNEATYPGVRGDAIIEVVTALDHRIYARGLAGTTPSGSKVKKYLRGYVRFSTTASNRAMNLMDWQEITESVIEERSLNSPKKTEFLAWLE